MLLVREGDERRKVLRELFQNFLVEFLALRQIFSFDGGQLRQRKIFRRQFYLAVAYAHRRENFLERLQNFFSVAH